MEGLESPEALRRRIFHRCQAKSDAGKSDPNSLPSPSCKSLKHWPASALLSAFPLTTINASSSQWTSSHKPHILTCSIIASISAPPETILPLSGPKKLASHSTRPKSPVAAHDRSAGCSLVCYKKHPPKPGGQIFPSLQLLSAFVVSALLIIQFWHISPPPLQNQKNTPLYPFADNVRRQEAYFDQLERNHHCKPRSLFSSELPYSQAPTNMALIEEAKRVAAEFNYPTDEVLRGVKEFIKEMDDGLEKQGAMLSQIPSYVTAVPNGTEKVKLPSLRFKASLTI